SVCTQFHSLTGYCLSDSFSLSLFLCPSLLLFKLHFPSHSFHLTPSFIISLLTHTPSVVFLCCLCLCSTFPLPISLCVCVCVCVHARGVCVCMFVFETPRCTNKHRLICPSFWP